MERSSEVQELVTHGVSTTPSRLMLLGSMVIFQGGACGSPKVLGELEVPREFGMGLYSVWSPPAQRLGKDIR